MRSLRFELETITPLFLAGAEQETAELRAASVRGIVRWWFRAMMGAIVRNEPNTAETVKKLENSVFGTTDQTSLVSIQVKAKGELKKYLTKEQMTKSKGAIYLGYAVFDWSKERKQHELNREAIKEGAKLEMTLRFHPASTKLQQAVFLNSLWLATHLGNFGTRARRGFGSMRCTDIDDQSLRNEFIIGTGQVKDYIERGIKRTEEVFIKYAKVYDSQIETASIFNNPTVTDFSTFGKWKLLTFRKEPAKSWRSYDEVLDGLGQEYRRFRAPVNRSGVPPHRQWVNEDYQNVVSDFLTGKFLAANPSKADIKNEAFDLPIQWRSSSGLAAILTGDSEIDRRSSPLYFKVLYDGDAYYLAVLLLESKFLPDGLDSVLSAIGKEWARKGLKKPDPIKINPANYEQIYLFLDSLNKKFSPILTLSNF